MSHRRTPHWRAIISAIVVFTVLANLLALNHQGLIQVADMWPSLRLAAVISTAAFLLWVAFDKWLWKILPQAITGWPNLNGIWKGDGTFTYAPGHDLAANPIELEVKIEIKQTYTSLEVHFESKNKANPKDETTSSGRGELEQLADGGNYILRYAFITLPGSYVPNNPGFSALTFRSEGKGRLTGEWVAGPKAKPVAGTLDVRRVTS